MADVTSYLKIYTPQTTPQLTEINYSEIKRYAGVISKYQKNAGKEDLSHDLEDLERIEKILQECVKEAIPVLTYKVSFREELILRNQDDSMILPFDYNHSKNLEKNLSGCNKIVMFAATVGLGLDRLIEKYNHISPLKALFMQSFGAERIEALCDVFNDEIKAKVSSENGFTKPRYSPGYGDLPLSVQKELMVILDCSRKLGISLNESLLMSPSKSVTAIIGIGDASAVSKE